MTKIYNQSFRRYLINELTEYPRRSGPIQFEGKSERYTRAIVSAFNTDNGTSYSVLKYGNGLLVGLRSDCRNYEEKPIEQPIKQLSAAEHLQRAVELFRAKGLGGDQMRAALNALMTVNDDLL
jgi:hypothetical protein